MAHTTFNPPAAWRASIPPTADDQTFRKRIIQGEVQDENASVLGGVAGHAGLFSTAEDLATFAHVLLQGGAPLVRRGNPGALHPPRNRAGGHLARPGLGHAFRAIAVGKVFLRASFGHLGYTGTSLWIDPERQLSVTLLTNRTWPDCENQAIKEVRPHFTMQWWKRWRKRIEATIEQHAGEPEPPYYRADQSRFHGSGPEVGARSSAGHQR